jgi:hypothetical protein
VAKIDEELTFSSTFSLKVVEKRYKAKIQVASKNIMHKGYRRR